MILVHNGHKDTAWMFCGDCEYATMVSVVVVYHVTIVAIGHGLLKKCWPFVTRLRSAHCREFNYLKLCRPAYFIRTTQLLPHPGHE